VYDWPETNWAELRSYRTDRLKQLMNDQQLDHLLFTGFDNIRYATDYRVMTTAENHDWFAALVDQDAQSRIFVPFVDEESFKPSPSLPHVRSWLPTPSWSPSTMHPEIYARLLAREIERSRARRVGFDLLPSQILEILRSMLPRVDFVSVAIDLFELRVDKHPIEVSLLRAASRVNAIAAEDAIAKIAPGMRDFDVLAIAMESLQRSGVEYMIHSVCNVRQPSGEWFANGAELRSGDAFFFDIGCFGQGGYASDICRTVFVGDPPDAVVRAYEILLEAYRAGQEIARPGVKACDVHATTNEVLVGNGLPRTPYAIGHGIGLRACEWPTIYRPEMVREDAPLQPGATIALEPETFVEVGDHIVVLKVEDNFVVTPDGLELLSHTAYGPE
jgi:Xaa-Pro aminopeptidase